MEFYNLPDHNGREDYNEARQYIADFVSSFSDVKALYEFGGVSVPGISDLDFMVVLNRRVNDKYIGEKLTFDQLPANILDLLDGSTMMVISEEHFENIKIWDDISLQKVCGEDVPVRENDTDTEHLLDICRVMDWAGERIIRLMWLEMTGCIPVKTALCVLHSFGYTIQKFNKLTNEKASEGIRILESIKRLRCEWFNSKLETNKKMLVSLLHETLGFGLDLIRTMSSYLEEYKYYSPVKLPRGVFLYLTQDSGYSFQSDPDKITFEYSKKISGEKNAVLVAVPTVWYIHFGLYAQSNGIISAAIKNNIIGQSEISSEAVNMELRDVLIQRIELCNKMALFLKRHKFTKGLFKFGWFYNP